MADITINNTIRHSDHLVITIDDGTNVATINHWIDDSLNIKEGGYARHDADRVGPALQTRRRQGDQMPSTVGFRVKRSDFFASTELRALMNRVAGDDGLVPEVTATIKLYDSQAAATGEQMVFANCIFDEMFNFTQSAQHDEVPINLTSHQPFATVTEFTDS